MKTKLFFIGILLSLFLISGNILAQSDDKQSASKIQVALLLDTSSSMDGLIDQAKTELWSVVNKLAEAKYKGQRPDLEIALYEYGNDGLENSDGYIRQVSMFTSDLDAISELLFSLRTYGGSEYCGMVIDKAAEDLNWTESHDHLKMIVIAGNEPFTQGSIDYKASCSKAVSAGIIVNTIFCGNHEEGIRTQWKDGADLADGKYMNIDQNREIAYIETPYDDEILKLNEQLNQTYIAYGQQGKVYMARQKAQDLNARNLNKKASVSRTVSKSSGVYQNAQWDLVDAAENEEVNLDEIPKEQLPEEMKGMNAKERKKYVRAKKEERKKIQAKIQDLNKKRDAYILKQRKSEIQEGTLGSALLDIVAEQAKDKNYRF